MMKYIIFLILVCGNLCAYDPFHICTIATYDHPNLAKLKKSCQKNNIDLDVIGMGMPYFGNATKLIYMSQYLEKIPDDHIVMFVDAFDVLIVTPKQRILSKFLRMNTPFVMAAEKNCCPYPHLADKYPPSETPFRFINTGTYIGYAKNIKQWLKKLQPIKENECDQAKATLLFLESKENQKMFQLDYDCQLFLPLFMVEETEVIIKNKVYCRTTNSFPSVIHANGASFKIWDKVYDKLIKD